MNTPFFTGQGDSGTVSVGRTNLSKDNPLFDILGILDTLNSFLGFAKVETKREGRWKRKILDVASWIHELQEMLFVAQAEIAEIGFRNNEGNILPKHRIMEEHTRKLEMLIAGIDNELPPLHQFIVPGGTELGARLDIARTLARDLERRAVALHSQKQLSPELLRFLNRLSSALFAFARYANHVLGAEEEHPKYT